jgi:hypothetical protein
MWDSRRLKSLSIQNPCHENWAGMSGGQRARFCSSCRRTVHDFSQLTRREAAKLIRRSDGRLCGRISHDDQGEVMFRHEPHAKTMIQLAGISLLSVSAFAQTPAANAVPGACTYQVRVVDAAGAPVPGAQVSAGPRHGNTGPDGFFSTNLPAGHYQVQITAPGFQPYTQPELNLSCDDHPGVTAEVRLQINVTMGVIVTIDEPSAIPSQKPRSKGKSAFRNLFRWRA